jgi:hypothetical protein
VSSNEILTGRAQSGGRSRPGGAVRPAALGTRCTACCLTPLLIVAGLGVGWLGWSVAEWRCGRTPSYRLTRLRVLRRSDGRPAGFCRSALRSLCCAVLILPTVAICLVVGLAFVMGASPPEGLLRQPRSAPWDVITRTEVVAERPRRRKSRLRLGPDWPLRPSVELVRASEGRGPSRN